MALYSSFPPKDETPQEKLLRATLQRQAAVKIDTEQAWSRIAPRLTASQQHQPAKAYSFFQNIIQQPRHTAIKKGTIFAAVAFIALCVLSISLTAGYTTNGHQLVQAFLPTSTPNHHTSTPQFQTIEQRQVSNGVVLTLEKAYTDSKQAIIIYTVPLNGGNGKIASQTPLIQPLDFVVKGQKETLLVKNQECTEELIKQIERCWLILSPIHVTNQTKTLTITWDISTVKIQHSHSVETRSGHWSFHFTLPFQPLDA